MGLFNRVQRTAHEKCPKCGSSIRRWVQFKYGNVRQLEYQEGDTLTWGANANDSGRPGAKRVVLTGHPEACPVCGDNPEYRYDIEVRNDRLTAFERAPLSDEHARFGHNYFVVLEE